jgi:hypothetical protein
MKLLFMQFSATSCHFIPICPNILNTLLSNTRSLCSSLNVSDQVSHPYRTAGRIVVLYILIFRFLDSRREDKSSGLNGSKHYQSSILLLISSWIKLSFLICS